jgi:hypothetical protein
MTAEQMIERSISHSEIVTEERTLEAADALLAACEDYVVTCTSGYDADGEECDVHVVEYWGSRDGVGWRVHLRWRVREGVMSYPRR